MGVLRLAHVDVRTPDLELSTAYYTEVLGLQRRRAHRRLGLPQVLGRGGPPLAAAALRLRGSGMDLFSFRVEREDDLARAREPAGRRYGCHVAAGQPRRGGRAGRVDPVRDPERPDHGAGLGPREDRQHPRQAQPVAGPAAGPAGHRAAADRPHAHQRRGGRRVLRLLQERARLPDDRAGARRQRPPARRLAGALALPARHRDRQRPQRRAAPLRVLARRLGPRPQGGRHPGLQRRPDRPGPDPARGHPRQHHLLLRPARHPQRGLHRRLQARPRLPARSPGPRTSSAAGSSTTRTSSRSGSCASTPDRGRRRVRPHPAPAARRDPGPRPRAVHGVLHRGRSA